MSAVSIRSLTRADEPFLWDALYYGLHVPSGMTLPRNVVKLPELARYVSGWMLRTTDLGFLAETPKQPVGAAWLRLWPGDERGYGFVDETTPELSISLLPGYRGQGIGSRLLRQLLDMASQRFSAVSLSVSVSNPAQRLYAREGFTVYGQPSGGSQIMLRSFA